MSAWAASHRRRAASWTVLVAAFASGAAGLMASLPARSGVAPSGCTPIDYVPPTYSGIEFGAAIQQNIFVNFLSLPAAAGCADCHTTNMGSMTPTGNLDLDPADDPPPYTNLINVASYDDPSLTYVVPNHPELSLLFWKVNCADPVQGVQMPFQGYPDGMTTLTAYQQALIWDWIAEGAPLNTTDGIFKGTFDIRGFVTDEIFSSGFDQ
jgi:hypothetical protein